jgi:hypothetical protein
VLWLVVHSLACAHTWGAIRCGLQAQPCGRLPTGKHLQGDYLHFGNLEGDGVEHALRVAHVVGIRCDVARKGPFRVCWNTNSCNSLVLEHMRRGVAAYTGEKPPQPVRSSRLWSHDSRTTIPAALNVLQVFILAFSFFGYMAFFVFIVVVRLRFQPRPISLWTCDGLVQ